MIKIQKSRQKCLFLLKITMAIIFSVLIFDYMGQLSLLRQQQEEIDDMLACYMTSFNNFQSKMDKTFPNINSIPDEKIREVYMIKQRIKMMSQILEEENRLRESNFLTPQNFYQIGIFEQKIKEEEKIIDLLYQNSKQFNRKKRVNFFTQTAKNPAFNDAGLLNALTLASFNLQTSYIDTLEKRKWESQIKFQQITYEEKYKINFYMKQLPFCVVINTKDNSKHFQFESTLQSILNQDYLNYRLVIVDDASTDHTVENMRMFLRQKKVPATQYVIIQNVKRKPLSLNVYSAIFDHCDIDDIAILMKGGDQLIGNYVFTLLNAAYRHHNATIVYTNHFYGNIHRNKIFKGHSQAYSSEEKQSKYRSVKQKFGPLKTFKVNLFLQIKISDLKQHQQWSQSEQSYIFPMLEMSCGRSVFINQTVYFYNYDGQAGDNTNEPLLGHFSQLIRSKPAYKCLPEYEVS